MTIKVKICGITHPEAMIAAVKGGAHYVGLVFYSRSPRAVSPTMAAQLIAHIGATNVLSVGLFVDPTQELLKDVITQVSLDVLQLHGNETPEDVYVIRQYFGLPVIKAFRLAVQEDVDAVIPYLPIVDYVLFDAKPPSDNSFLPGGNGMTFDWSLVMDRHWSCPWILSGGLTNTNLAQAITQTKAQIVDVSSGVEDYPGHKDPLLIHHFLRTAAQL